MDYNGTMKTFLIRPEYLENLHNLLGKELISKDTQGNTAYIREVCHVEPWGDDRRRGDMFTLVVDGDWFVTYRGNEGYRKFMREWGATE